MRHERTRLKRLATAWDRLLLPVRHAAAVRAVHSARSRHARARWVTIGHEMRGAEPDCVIIAGDSHAECLGRPAFGHPAVNAGIAGITAAQFAMGLEKAAHTPQSLACILLIGSNDTVIELAPLSAARMNAFQDAVRRILRSFRGRSGCVIVCAIPPVRKPMIGIRDRKAMIVYSQMLRSICDHEVGIYFDPFEAMRSRTDPTLMPCGGDGRGGMSSRRLWIAGART